MDRTALGFAFGAGRPHYTALLPHRDSPPTDPADLHAALLAWFAAHARDLPWRLTAEDGRRDPYRVWVSEILLQQTQVVRGRVYFERFLRAFPTVRDLADAPEEAVLKAWEGCGYYARARNLHRAAKQLAVTGFPTTHAGWLAVPGVGPYTASAVSSIAYGEARAVNDGNVRRVLSRLYARLTPEDAWVQRTADTLLYTPDPGRWNEAVMDLGATVCVPKAPRCGECPLRPWCAAYATGRPGDYPAPKPRAEVREVTLVAVLIGDARHAYLETREGALLGGLSGLPTHEVGPEGRDAALTALLARLGARDARFLGTVTHVMTHRRITLHVHEADADLPRVDVDALPLSNLDRKALALTNGTRPLLTV